MAALSPYVSLIVTFTPTLTLPRVTLGLKASAQLSIQSQARRNNLTPRDPASLDPAGQADTAVERHVAKGRAGHRSRLPEGFLSGKPSMVTAVLALMH